MAQGAPNLQNEPKLIDSSAPLFSMYNKREKEHDEKMTENWKGDAEGILVFTGLFSAAVAQLLGSSLQNLQPDPQNASSFYLAHIYQLTPGSNVSSIPFDDPATFEPPTSAIWVSTLWSLSLVVSLTCALLATLLQQWARRYLDITQKRNDPQKRAQTRELISRALTKAIPLSWTIELLPFLLHTSVFLFLAGFVAYLFTFNNLVAKVVGACAGASLFSYLYVSLAPIYSRDSPYSTPLTTLGWTAIMGFISVIHRFWYFVAWSSTRFQGEDLDRIQKSFEFYHQRMLNGTAKDVERLADAASSGLASSVLLSTFKSLDGDSDIDQFLSCIPGFYTSALAIEHSHRAVLNWFNSHILPRTIISFMEHVLSSDLLQGSEKEATVTTCLKAIKADEKLLASTFQETLRIPDSVILTQPDFVRLAVAQLPRFAGDAEPVKDYAHCVVALAINRTQLDDRTWIDITASYLERHHVRYRREPHNLRFCNLICLTQYLKTFQLMDSDQFGEEGDWHNALVGARKLEVTGIALELREEFLRLWDELDNVAQRGLVDQMTQNAIDVQALLLDVYNAVQAHP